METRERYENADHLPDEQQLSMHVFSYGCAHLLQGPVHIFYILVTSQLSMINAERSDKIFQILLRLLIFVVF